MLRPYNTTVIRSATINPMTFLGPPPPESPARIVSLVPSLTETLADLGLDDEVVGLTRFCVHPAGWKASKTIVGGTKSVNVDRILSLEPDLVLANREENVKEQVERLAESVPVALTDVATVDEGIEMIRNLGVLCNRKTNAETLANEIERTFPDRSPALSAAYLIWRNPWMTIGGDTFISDVMQRAGFGNVFAGHARYPETRLETLRESNADIILLSSEPFPFREKHLEEVEMGTQKPVLLVDGQAFSWYGSRMKEAPKDLDETWRQAGRALSTYGIHS